MKLTDPDLIIAALRKDERTGGRQSWRLLWGPTGPNADLEFDIEDTAARILDRLEACNIAREEIRSLTGGDYETS